MRVAVANLKGGTAKTTTAVFLAHVMAAEGRTLLVDADPQGSALGWAETAEELPFSTVSLPVRNLHRQLPDLAANQRHSGRATHSGWPAPVEVALAVRDLLGEAPSRLSSAHSR